MDALPQLWLDDPSLVESRHVHQVISFAGEGRLLDGSECSREFRSLLRVLPPEMLERYADECLSGPKFDDNGGALQDIVNEIGRRLGFTVENGRYRGVSNAIGNDGLWVSPEGHCIVIESKVTDTYRIDLDTLATYRKRLVSEGSIDEQASSILIVVGRQSTADLEAQVRGSRHAWDVRLISVRALVRLMSIVIQEVDDPRVVSLVRTILVPREFTKIDAIIEVLFSTTEETRNEPAETSEDDAEAHPRFTPVQFNAACIRRTELQLETPLIKRSRSKYESSEGTIRVVCIVSRARQAFGGNLYWFAFHPHQKEFLEGASRMLVAFGCGTDAHTLLIPAEEFFSWLGSFWQTQKYDRFYWHVQIVEQSGRFVIRLGATGTVDITEYLLAAV